MLGSTVQGQDPELTKDELKTLLRRNVTALDLADQRHEKMLADLITNLQILSNSLGTLRNEFEVFKSQHAMHLAKTLNGGPTGPTE